LQILSAICFGPLEGKETTPLKVENKLLQKIQALPFVKDVTADIRIRGIFQQRAVTEEEFLAAASEDEEGREEGVEAAGFGGQAGMGGKRVIKAFSTGAAKSLYKGMGRKGGGVGGGGGGMGGALSAPSTTPSPTIAPPRATRVPTTTTTTTSSSSSPTTVSTATFTNTNTTSPPPTLPPSLPPSGPAIPPGPPGGSSPWVVPDDLNWGLDRINQLGLDLDQNTNTCQSKGKGVVLFSVDTGCRVTHQEFGGRASTMSVRLPSKTEEGKEELPYGGTGGDDDHGHGSHTAAIAGGASVGVAPLVEIRCIKALDEKGVGNLAHAIAALEMIAQERLAAPHTPMIASLSISAPVNKALNAAVARLQNLGVVVVVAAGNDGKPVQYYSPASEGSAITVGATQPPLPPGTSAFVPQTGDKREAYSNLVRRERGREGGREGFFASFSFQDMLFSDSSSSHSLSLPSRPPLLSCREPWWTCTRLGRTFTAWPLTMTRYGRREGGRERWKRRKGGGGGGGGGEAG